MRRGDSLFCQCVRVCECMVVTEGVGTSSVQTCCIFQQSRELNLSLYLSSFNSLSFFPSILSGACGLKRRVRYKDKYSDGKRGKREEVRMDGRL